MIALWMANPGEDFRISKYDDRTVFVTAEGVEMGFGAVARYPLPIIGKTKDTMYLAFFGQRVAIPKEQAMRMQGEILGKTQVAPEIRTAPASCPHDCSHCNGCCH